MTYYQQHLSNSLPQYSIDYSIHFSSLSNLLNSHIIENSLITKNSLNYLTLQSLSISQIRYLNQPSNFYSTFLSELTILILSSIANQVLELNFEAYFQHLSFLSHIL